MALSSHISELRKKHQTLSEKIETEQRRPGVDDLHLRDLKRQKLNLKDEIQRLDGQL